MLKTIQNKPIISIVLLVLVMLAFSIDSLPVSIMEARNFITAREMVSDGHWLLTTMNGEARYEKPPLPTWLTAIFGSIFGLKNLLALRFPAIILIAHIGVFIYLLSKKLVTATTHSFVNALIAITSFYVIGITLEAPWDIYTHGFMLIAIYYLFLWFESSQNTPKCIFMAGLFIGFSILCKGPISIYALMLPFLLAYGFTYKYKNFKSNIIPLLGCMVLALIVGGWWYFYVRLVDPETFTAIAEKETSNWHSYNVKPFYYYWSFFTQSGIWTIPAFISLLYPYLKSRVSNLKAYKFSLLWTVFAVILLSVIPEKKSRYLMPVLIPLAINTGFYIEYLLRSFKDLKDKKETIPVYFNFGLIALVGITFPIITYLLFGEQLKGFWIRFVLASIVAVGIGVSILYQLKKKNIMTVFGLTVLFFVTLFLNAVPLSEAMVSKSYNPVSRLRQDGFKVYGFNNISPELIWQYGDKLPPLKLENGIFNFPEEKQFGMLANGISQEDWTFLQTQYSIKKVETFNLNQVSKNARNYNERLVNDYYILTKH